jgi:LmbE family N-acetylglucosaminyl deacetylase
MRWIYISPHLDDAIFSAGGLMHEQLTTGNPVEIWTIMCGIPDENKLTDFAKALHKFWKKNSARELIHDRRTENEMAAGILGAKTMYFEFLDCIYRRGPTDEILYMNTFGKPHKADIDLPIQIAHALAAHLMSDDMVVAPLAIGEHVDHVVVRNAAELLGRSLHYIADIPYFLNNPQKIKPKTSGMLQTHQSISKTGLDFWLDAMHAYESQIEMEFTNPELMKKKISAYWSKNKGINFWQAR